MLQHLGDEHMDVSDSRSAERIPNVTAVLPAVHLELPVEAVQLVFGDGGDRRASDAGRLDVDAEMLAVAGKGRRPHTQRIEVLLRIAVERLASLLDVITATEIHLHFGQRVERIPLRRETPTEPSGGIAVCAIHLIRDPVLRLPRLRDIRRDGSVLVGAARHRYTYLPIEGPPGAAAPVKGPVANGSGRSTPGARPSKRARFINRVAVL